jgi:hypothetical protein
MKWFWLRESTASELSSVANTVEPDLVRVYREPQAAGALPRATLRRHNHPLVRSVILRYSLTYRDPEEVMAERNLSVDFVTI